MFPDGFQYERADTVDEAVELLAEHADSETELLAGGHSLLPVMKTRLASPDVVIDIGRIEALHGIERDGETIDIGALTPYAEIETAESLRNGAAAIAEAASEIGDVQVRNMGTIGGNLAHADPASDMPAGVLAANATIHVQGRDGERAVAAEDFFQGVFATDLGEDEILTRIEILADDDSVTAAYVKRPNPASGYAVVGVAAAVRTTDGAVESARVATTGATDHAVRLPAVERSLVDEPLSESVIESAAEAATDELNGATLMDDDYASDEFRGQLLKQYTRRALTNVSERA